MLWPRTTGTIAFPPTAGGDERMYTLYGVNETMQLTGMHHVSALTADIRRNYRFYTDVLGMRLVKKTVNQDNPLSYHLFYGDERGNAGTELTYFDIPNAAPTHRGTNSISNTALRVRDGEALAYWQERFAEHDVAHGAIRSAAGRSELPFEDFEGQRLSLVADGDESGVAGGTPWIHSPVPQDVGIIGLGPSQLTVGRLEPTASVLTDVLGFREAGQFELDGDEPEVIHVFATGEGGAGAEVHVIERGDLPGERLGRGGVHHIAFRVPDEDGQYEAWLDRIEGAGYGTSGLVDRFYFRSIYFREPNGILFELATDGPGFATDEPVETLGESLALPPFLEGRRPQIEAGLTPLHTVPRKEGLR